MSTQTKPPSPNIPLWAQRMRWIARGGARRRLRDVRGASAAMQRLVLLMIADVCDDDGRIHEDCELTVASLAGACLCHEDTARRALKALRDAELITAEPRPGRSTRFSLVIDHIERIETDPHGCWRRGASRIRFGVEDPYGSAERRKANRS